MLYTLKNIAPVGSVFVDKRGIGTIGPGKSKDVELSDADRGHPDILTLEQARHLEVTPAAKPSDAPKAEVKTETKPGDASKPKAEKPAEQK